MTRQKEIAAGVVIGQWRVVSETPTRGVNGLMWTISCPLGHEVQVEHSRLSYGVVPIQCAACIEAEAAARAADKVNEKRIVKEAAMEMLEKMQQEKQQPVQIEGLGEPDKPFGHVRAIQIVAQSAQQQGIGEI